MCGTDESQVIAIVTIGLFVFVQNRENLYNIVCIISTLQTSLAAGTLTKLVESVEDVKLQLNNHSRAFSALTTEVRNAIQLLPPLHAVVPLDAQPPPNPPPNFNLPLSEVTDLSVLNMLLADKENVVAFVSGLSCYF